MASDDKRLERLTLDSIDAESDEQLEALMAQVLAEGNKVYAAQRAETVQLGIIDEQGRLLSLPEYKRIHSEQTLHNVSQCGTASRQQNSYASIPKL